jgi:hypothetical protein
MQKPMTLSEFIPIIVALITAGVGWYANRVQLLKYKEEVAERDRARILEADEKAKRLEIDQKTADAGLAEHYLDLTRSAATDVSTVMKEVRELRAVQQVMQTQIDALTLNKFQMQLQIDKLTADKQTLEETNAARGAQIEQMNDRIIILEDLLRKNGIDVPNGYKYVGPERRKGENDEH